MEDAECIGGDYICLSVPGEPTEDPETTCDDELDNDCDGNTDDADDDCSVACPCFTKQDVLDVNPTVCDLTNRGPGLRLLGKTAQPRARFDLVVHRMEHICAFEGGPATS